MFSNIKEIIKKTPLIRIICFLIILFLLITNISYALLYRDRKTDNSSFQVINYYNEKKNSLDVVFVGSSSCFSFYSPLFAYNSYGIKTANYSSSGMGMLAYQPVVEEIVKTQKNTPIVITLSSQDEMNYTSLHYLADYMPMSKNKLQLLLNYFSKDDENILNSVEYFFPLMRFHERWSQLTLDDLKIDDGTKGATSHIYYLTYVNDISDDYYISDKKEEIPDSWERHIGSLLDYCKSNEVEVMFILPPKLYKTPEYEELNSLVDYIQERGYFVLDMRDKMEEIGLNPRYDYYDKYHTNVHGSVKYTDYVIDQVMEVYNIHPSGNDKGFEIAFNNYFEKIKNNIIKEELDMNNRDYHLEMPLLKTVAKESNGIKVLWDNVEKADGYLVYRNNGNGWMQIADVVGKNEYIDNEFLKGTNMYTVMSYANEDSGMKYGNYDYKGLSIEVND